MTQKSPAAPANPLLCLSPPVTLSHWTVPGDRVEQGRELLVPRLGLQLWGQGRGGREDVKRPLIGENVLQI